MNSKCRVILIGSASHAFAEHGTFLEDNPNVEVVGIVEPHPQIRAQLILDYPKLKISDDAGDLCQKAGADIALICYVEPSQIEFAITSVIDHCHTVLIEKPGGIYSERLAHLAARTTAQGVLATVGYYYRFHSQVQLVAESFQKLPSGPGRVLKLHLTGEPAIPNTWQAAPRSGGGALRILGVHLLDLAVQIAGPLTLQSVDIRSNQTPEDEVHLEYGTTDGSLVEIHVSFDPEPHFSIEASSGDEVYQETLWGRGLVSAFVRRTLHGSVDTARDAALATWWRHALLHDPLAPSLYEAADILQMIEEIEALILPS